ncbi:MAG: hypothetical protein AAFY34_08705 [Pseudomonadota bacterium]
MPKASPLNLAAVDPAVWQVYIGTTVYGPYTLGQLQGFVEEGRVATSSLVSKGDAGTPVKAGNVEELHDAFTRKMVQEDPKKEPPVTGARSNYVIITQLTRTSDVDLIVCLNSLGDFASIFPGTFVLSSAQRLPDIQQAVNDAVTLDDQVMIVNASTGRLGWLNIGTDTDIHLREIWAAGKTSTTPDEAQ